MLASLARPISLATVILFLLGGGPAAALEKCKARTARDGTILVSAKDVVPPLRFGNDPDRVVTEIDGDECIRKGKAKKCALGDEGEDARITPPPFCTVHLEDEAGSCEAPIRGCTVGLRPACPPDMERMGAGCIEKTVNAPANGGNALLECAARGRTLCSVEELMVCDSLNLSKGFVGSCGTVTDPGGAPVWAIGSNSEEGQNVFDRRLLYTNGNVIDEFPASDNFTTEGYFCCAPLGTP